MYLLKNKGLFVVCLGLLASGCPVSQPIVVTFPKDATWSFEYADAVGEKLGHGKAQVSFERQARRFSMALTENAFGDRATLGGVLPEAADEQGRVRFEASGRWFDGQKFAFVGCFDHKLTRVLPGAVAFVADQQAQHKDLPAVRDVCDESEPKPAGKAHVDRLFFWYAVGPKNR